MTTITKTIIPNNINTLERLALWAGFGLQKLNPTKTIVEQANTDPINVASVSIFRADDQSLRALIRIDLPIDTNYAESEDPMWMSALELSNTDLPVSYQEPPV